MRSIDQPPRRTAPLSALDGSAAAGADDASAVVGGDAWVMPAPGDVHAWVSRPTPTVRVIDRRTAAAARPAPR